MNLHDLLLARKLAGTGGSGGGGAVGGDGYSYRVRFYVEGVLYDEQWVRHGESAVTPAEPTKEPTEQNTYTFARWDGSYSNVTAPKDINAVFTDAVRMYTVRFYNGEELLHTEYVPYGGNATPPADPVKEGEWAFTGWKPEPVNITADMDCYAEYKSTTPYSRKLIDRSIDASAAHDGITKIGIYGLSGCNNLTTANFPAVTSIDNYAFAYCSNLTTVDLAAATSMGDGGSYTYVFYQCPNLSALILRKTDAVCTLSSTNSFDSTKIKSGTGYIYVPSALVDSYKAAAKWSTFANQFRALEDYTVDGTTTGELDPTKI